MTSVTLANGAVNSSAGLDIKVNSTTKVLSFNTSGAYGVGSTPAYGTAGQVLTSAGIGATPTWGNDITGNAATATNLAGGAANRIHYQTGSGTSAFLPAPSTIGTVLGWTGSAIDWVNAPAATTTANISGGAAGVIPYQSASGTTSFSAVGISGQILTSTGTTAPTWISTLPIANGGTNSTATATAGGIGYGTGTAHAYTAAGTAGQVLVSSGSGTPLWATPSVGAMTLISTKTGSGINSLSWTGLSGSYSYLLVFNGLNSSGFIDNVMVRAGSGGSIISSAYSFAQFIYDGSTANTYFSGSQSGVNINAVNSLTNISGYMYIIQTPTSFDISFTGANLGTGNPQCFVNCTKTFTGTITNIQVANTSRSWTGGSASLYQLST